MNMWTALVPEQRVAYQQPVARQEEYKRKQFINDAEIMLAQALEAKRHELGLTQVEFGAALGISQQQYNNIKSGRRAMCAPAIKRAYALGVGADVLLGNAEVSGLSTRPPGYRAGINIGEK